MRAEHQHSGNTAQQPNVSTAENADRFDGILLVDKPSGPTSHDVVLKIRHRFRIPKVGHGGTLDPQSTGLLIMLIGRGTKLSNGFLATDKVYEGSMMLGVATDSHDAQGNIVKVADAGSVTRELLECEMKKFTGDILQTPPMVSAVKQDGVPLYKLARKGKDVERKPKLVHIYEFKLVDFQPPRASFFIRCTKGTYVRTICADIGTALGCGAHLEKLRRIQCGDMHIHNATPLDELLDMDRQRLAEKIIPIESLSWSGRKD